MPNWVSNKLVITGEDKYLNTLRNQMNKPYQTHHFDVFENAIQHQSVEGQFLLWNVVRPTNEEAYYEYDKNIKRAEEIANREPDPRPAAEKTAEIIEKMQDSLNNFTPEAMAEAMQRFHKEMEVGQDWYNWNIREWGTKWEIQDAFVTQGTGELRYEFATAWSPPQPALSKLASQYPMLTFTLRCLDEGHCFASEMHWRNGFMEFETDIEINHGLLEEMYGECHNCGDGNENDPDYDQARIEMKCAEFNKPIELEELL